MACLRSLFLCSTTLWLWNSALLLGQTPPSTCAAITPEEMKSHIWFLSSDLLEGRGIGTRGDRLTTAYLECQFRRCGLAPAFDGQFAQPLELLRITPDPHCELSFSGDGFQVSGLRFGDDFVAVVFDPELADRFHADLMYLGYGIQSPTWNWNDYKNLNVRGKVLLMHVNEPGRDDPDRFQGNALTYFGRWTYKYEQAARAGALGVILIHADADAGYDWTVVKNSWSGDAFVDSQAPDILPFQAWMRYEQANALLQREDLNLEELRQRAERADFRPVPLNVKVAFHASTRTRPVTTHNVAAYLPAQREARGSIVVSAHHDHLGIRGTTGDTVYNGAVDNGSALSTMLSVAGMMGQSRPELGVHVVFLACAAEEEGMWGSRRFARQPPSILQPLVANINFELTWVWSTTRDFIAIGGQHSELGELIEEVARHRGMIVSPESSPEQGYFFRSDQFSFAREGIPAVWFDCGDLMQNEAPEKGRQLRRAYRERAYHRPTDEYDPAWSMTGTVALAEATTELIRAIDQLNRPPHWNPSSPFSAVSTPENATP